MTCLEQSVDILRNGIFMAVVAHGLIGISLLWDKILLRKPGTQNLVSYVFWLGAMSGLGIFLAVLGFHMPPLRFALLAFASGALQLAANFFYYEALQRGEASEALAILGGFSPVATALIAAVLLDKIFDKAELLGFLLLVGGGFVMFLTERVNYRALLAPVLLASGFFGLVNVTQKMAFNRSDFVSGYVCFTMGTFAGSLLLLVRPSWRKQIFENTGDARSGSRFWYFVNRFVNGVGSFLVYYAISLANPAIVDAVSAVRYVIIFLGAYVITVCWPKWLHEEFNGIALVGKAAATGLVLVALRGSVTSTTGPHRTPPGRLPAIVASARPRAECTWPEWFQTDNWPKWREWRS